MTGASNTTVSARGPACSAEALRAIASFPPPGAGSASRAFQAFPVLHRKKSPGRDERSVLGVVGFTPKRRAMGSVTVLRRELFNLDHLVARAFMNGRCGPSAAQVVLGRHDPQVPWIVVNRVLFSDGDHNLDAAGDVAALAAAGCVGHARIIAPDRGKTFGVSCASFQS
jgi:hypothetical protein